MPNVRSARQVILQADEINDEECPVAAAFDSHLPPDLEFTAVPRKPRTGGLTVQRQRIFIKLLAACGSVKMAALAISTSNSTMYKVRHSPGAESFAAAWDKAVERGARRVLDVMIDHAINGIPEKIYQEGKLVAERRRFNTRAQMWIVAHNFPEKYAVSGGLMHSASGPIGLARLKKQWRDEWLREIYVEERQREADALTSINTKINAIRRGFKRDIAADGAKRAAWELLTGPTDWSDFDKVTDYGWNLPATNQTRPDMVVANAMGMDALYGMRPEKRGSDNDGNGP